MIAFEDLLIATTALQLRFVATSNARHFQVVPGLTVVPS
jgi:predicted nucleic acid-binding protein